MISNRYLAILTRKTGNSNRRNHNNNRATAAVKFSNNYHLNVH